MPRQRGAIHTVRFSDHCTAGSGHWAYVLRASTCERLSHSVVTITTRKTVAACVVHVRGRGPGTACMAGKIGTGYGTL